MADDEFKFDAAMLGRLSGALSFVVGATMPRPKP